MKKIFYFIILVFIIFSSFDFVSSISTSVRIPEKYTDIEAGERFYFEVEIKYPENTIRKDLRIHYDISDNKGDSIVKSKTLKAIETQMSFVDYIVIPQNTKEGMYVLDVEISDYENLKKNISASFHVKNTRYDEFKAYFIILIGAILLVAVLIVINIFVSRRK